ncbi:hypothetical protein HYFRA_00002584 [Hymenoscyphus fraxineus]|uniref:Zn(2)-C6 fungal-type domain-containing protein n=1 Tax=Hymenoscyphus fraxineus TaxID=746836 RepID=A0A9N9L8H9_9HELO|nr:hypothetical protein HYFRA_00002584 [Hymenoscyphus fraxineus]
MSFRKIRPSFGDSSASISTSTPSQSTSDTTGSDPRRVRGDKEGESAGAPSTSKRRRVPDSVTRNACLNCKKARAKCDGKKPCKRCASRVETSECVYEVHIKHAKEELVKQIKELKARDHLTDQILQALSTDEKVPEILERLKNGEEYESIVEWLGRSPIEDFETLSPRTSQHSTFEVSDDHEMGGIANVFRWTTVTYDSAVLDHLFQLYFAWVHPVHTLFSEGHFVDSYKRQSDNYCSSVLVNAICAMACHLHSPTDTDEVDYERLREEFSNAVRVRLDPGDHTVTTIQAFGVMFLVDCARSKSLRASSYLRVAADMLLHVATTEVDPEVWKNTIWGIQNLTVEWAQITCQAPQVIEFPVFDAIADTDVRLDHARWYFYRQASDQCPAWPGLLVTTNREKSKLIRIIQEISRMLYSRTAVPLSAHEVLQQYSRLTTWRENLPSIIGDVDNNPGQALPHVLSLLILYSNSVIQLLRPLLGLEGFQASWVEDIIWNHAQQGLYLLDEHYRTQYTCRYQPVLQMFAILHLTDIIARFFPGGKEGGSKDGPDAITFGMDALMQSYVGFPIAGPLQELLRRSANELYIRLPRNLSEISSLSRAPKQTYHLDDIIDACTRPTYLQPVLEIRTRFVSSFAVDWAAEGASFGFPGISRVHVPSAEERGAQSLMQIHNLLNSN